MNCRGAAAQILHRLVTQNQSLTPLLAHYETHIPDQDRGLLQALCFGSCRHYFSINAISKMLMVRPLPENDGEVQALIWVGLFQLAHSEISPHAAINETVKACEQLGFEKYKSLVNAILRRFQREESELMAGLRQSDVPAYEHPKWLLKMLKKSWPEHWQTITQSANLHPPMTLRVNTHKQSRPFYSEQLNVAEIEHYPTPLSSSGITLTTPRNVAHLPQFSQGSCSVQDEAAQLAAEILNPQKGERILDACAAPGGKTCALLERVEGAASVLAVDADQNRLQRVHENLQRLGYTAEVKCGEAQDAAAWWDGTPFDRILLDVPCSATGVIRRHPDIKLLRQREDIAKLATLQGEILRSAWQQLKPGGHLLYATCSILPQENADNIAAFLNEQMDAQLQSLPAHLEALLTQAQTTDAVVNTGAGWQLFPQANGHDGFFYALLKKADV